MKARTPFWPLERVKALAAADQLVLTRARALRFFVADEVAVAAAKGAIAELTSARFSETLRQPAPCDVYGVHLASEGWYLKITIDGGPPEELIVVSLHPLERPLRTNTGIITP